MRLCKLIQCHVLYNDIYLPIHLGNTPQCAEEQLPIPGNGSVHCTQREDDLKCTLTCQDMFAFGSSVDVSPQYCQNGIWEFQRDEIEIPDCQREHIPLTFQYIEPDTLRHVGN